MSTYLLDVNVLLALAWPNHLYHDRAHEWIAAEKNRSWATCPTTQSSFIRLSLNPKVIGRNVFPEQVLDLLDANLSSSNHVFWRETISTTKILRGLADNLVGHRQITDAYLLGLAHQKRGILATFDRGIGSMLSPASLYQANLETILP